MKDDNDIVLSVRNISKCFEMYEKPVHRLYQTLCAGKKKFYKEFWALKGISFDMVRGESVGIVGRNGAGKSTLLQIITGTLAPTSGHVESKGRIAALLELGSGFNPEFTGRENVYLNASILGLTKGEIDARYQEIVDFADIGDFISQPVKTYSSGMLARLAYAVNAHVDADILIVDEALAVGDSFFQQKCLLHMKKLMASGVSLLFVSHSTSTVREICQKSLYIDRGRQVLFADSASAIEYYLEDQNRALCKKSGAPVTIGPVGESEDKSADLQFKSEDSFVKKNLGRRYGSRRAVINGVDVLSDSGREQDGFITGEMILFRMYVVANDDVREACFNLKISTANGVGVTHISSFERGYHFDLRKGRRYVVDVRIKNVFGGGRQFMLQAGLTSVYSGVVGEHEILDCIECCNVFSSTNRKDLPVWELVDVPFELSVNGERAMRSAASGELSKVQQGHKG